MLGERFASKAFRNILVLGFSLWSFTFFSGIAGCDGGATKDSAASDQGNSVDTTHSDTSSSNPPPSQNGGNPALPPPGGGTVKNVILLIGSGMGPQQIGEVVQYRRLRQPDHEKLALEKLFERRMMGMVATNSYLDLV